MINQEGNRKSDIEYVKNKNIVTLHNANFTLEELKGSELKD